MENLPDLLAQLLPILAIAFVLLVGWTVVRVGLRLSNLIFHLGCAALIIFMCGIVSFMVLYNFASR